MENVQVTVSIQPEGTDKRSVPANTNVKINSDKAGDQIIQQIEKILLEEWGVPREAVNVIMQQK
ncbi:hypothetical protein D3C81_2125240 [compost metagenome]